MSRLASLLGLSVLLGACSAEISVNEIGPEDPPGTTVDGIPFRTNERYVVKIYQKTDQGYVERHEQMETLPNPNKIYVLRHLGQMFSNSDTKFVLNDNGTLSTVHLGADSQLDEAVAALEQGVSDAGKTLDEIRSAEEARRTAEEGQLTTEEDLDVAYQKALNAANKAIVERASLGDNATPADIVEKDNQVALTKLEANIAARRAGLPRPFPEVTL
jgi:hypothetical protein